MEKLSDKEYAVLQMKNKEEYFHYLPEKLMADKDVAIAAMDEDSVLNVLDYLPKALTDNLEVAAHAATQMDKVQSKEFTNHIMQTFFSERINKLIDPEQPGLSLTSQFKQAQPEPEPEQKPMPSSIAKHLASMATPTRTHSREI